MGVVFYFYHEIEYKKEHEFIYFWKYDSFCAEAGICPFNNLYYLYINCYFYKTEKGA